MGRVYQPTQGARPPRFERTSAVTGWSLRDPLLDRVTPSGDRRFETLRGPRQISITLLHELVTLCAPHAEPAKRLKKRPAKLFSGGVHKHLPISLFGNIRVANNKSLDMTEGLLLGK